MRSKTLPRYQEWVDSNPGAVDFVDRVYFYCEKLYDHGGDEIVELLTPVDILAKYKCLNDVRRQLKWPSPPVEAR